MTMLSLLGGLPLTRSSLSLVPVAVPRVRFGLLVGVVLASLASCSHPRRLRRCAEFLPTREASADDTLSLKIVLSCVGPRLVGILLVNLLPVINLFIFGTRSLSRSYIMLFLVACVFKQLAKLKVFKNGDSIPMRRCKRLHRAAAEQTRQGNLGTLTPSQHKHWCAALSSGLVPLSITSIPQNQAHAISMASNSIASLQLLADRASKDSWSQTFRSWCLDSIRATKCVLSPTAPPVCATPDQLLDDWTPQFVHSEAVDRQSCWEQFAVEAGLHATPSSEDTVVPLEKFCFWLDFSGTPVPCACLSLACSPAL